MTDSAQNPQWNWAMVGLDFASNRDRKDGLIRAAQYVRMSTEHQRYSTENQSIAIAAYAVEHGMVVVRTYADEGKSGLRIDGRYELQRLLKDVQLKPRAFDVVLVYDISRWGRFQDADESAHYEYLCRQAGVRIEYCAEPFENDGTPISMLMKSIKRLMAGEYSRELSNKVFAGQFHQVVLGFRQGGRAGFGLRRKLVDEHLNTRIILGHGERKLISTDHILLIPGPAEETKVVRRIYKRFLRSRCSFAQIARELNKADIPAELGHDWTYQTVRTVLTNEKYIGNNIYGMTSSKLRKGRRLNPPDQWARSDGVFEKVIPNDLFIAARKAIAARARLCDKQGMICRLAKLYARYGYLSAPLIDQQSDMASSLTYRRRFGGLLNAYASVGYFKGQKTAYIEAERLLKQFRPELIARITNGLQSIGAVVTAGQDDQLLTVNNEFTVWVAVARGRQHPGHPEEWIPWPRPVRVCDVAVIMRLTVDSQQILDYYILPGSDLPKRLGARTKDANGMSLDIYRSKSFEPIYALAKRVSLASSA